MPRRNSSRGGLRATPAWTAAALDRTWLWVSGIVAIVALTYMPAVGAGFIWDDDAHITGNATLRSLDGLRRIWFEPTSIPQYYPLTHTSFWIEYHLWGSNAAGYHVVNIVLHAVNSVLVGLVLRRLAVPGAWLAAALFAAHPVHVESVAWVSERKNVLSLALSLGALLAWLRLSPPQFGIDQPTWSWRLYGLVALLFAGALLSKTVACSLPAVMLIIAWWKRGRITPRDWRAVAPLLALGLAAGLMTAYLEKHHVGALGDDWSLGPIDRLLIAGRAVWFYAAKLVWPVRLSFIYERWNIDPRSVWQYLFPAAAAALILTLWKLRGWIGRGPLAAALFFGGTLVPALGVLDVYPMRYSFVADHFQYAASLGLIALAGAGAALGLRRLGAAPRAVGGAACAGAVAVLATLAWKQTHIYHDQLTLWNDTIAKNPAWMPYHSLGNTLFQQGSYGQAIDAFERSLALRPDNVYARTSLGSACEAQGDLERARAQFAEALRLDPDWPTALNNLGLLLVKLRKLPEAENMFRRLLAKNPGDAVAHNNLGMTLELAGDRSGALDEYKAAAEIEPDYAEARYNLANCQFAFRNFEQAQRNYRRALASNPKLDEARNNLASLLLALGDDARVRGNEAEALEHFNRAVEEYVKLVTDAPASATARQNLATAYERLGRNSEALATLEEALRILPGNPQLRKSLARLRAHLGAVKPQG